VLAACWAHTRRKFYEVRQATDSPIAAGALRQIAKLYAVEDRIRGRSAELRRGVRQELARPLVSSLKTWLGHPICLGPLGGSLPLPGGWPGRARHQHDRAGHPADRVGAEEPSVRRLRPRGRSLGHRLLPRVSRRPSDRPRLERHRLHDWRSPSAGDRVRQGGFRASRIRRHSIARRHRRPKARAS
jgi:hypothetical protein